MNMQAGIERQGVVMRKILRKETGKQFSGFVITVEFRFRRRVADGERGSSRRGREGEESETDTCSGE